MAKVKICGYECEVVTVNEYARGPNGRCAFCDGDPCLEYPERHGDTAMKQYDKDEGGEWSTCPCCEGRPT